MKKGLLFCMLAVMATAAMAQTDTTTTTNDTVVTVIVIKKPKNDKAKFGGDGVYLRDSTWRIGGNISIMLSQTALYQWGPGGNNNFSFLLSGNFFASYKKGKLISDNSIDAKWGMVANGLIRNKALAQSNLQKNIDIFSLKSTVGYEVSKSLYATARLGFESQFTPTYDYSLTDTSNGRFRRYTVSKFAAPAVLTVGPGLTWKPKTYFTLFFSPAHGKMTFVTPDTDGRDTTTNPADGTYLDSHYNSVDETRFGLTRGEFFMGEFGWELDILFQKDIIKNVNWKSHLNVFGAYVNARYNTSLPTYYADLDSMGSVNINPITKHIPVVKWENDIILKVNSWLSATLSAKFVYQYNALVPIDIRKNDTGKKGPDGITDQDRNGVTRTGYNRLQIFEQFGVSLTAKF